MRNPELLRNSWLELTPHRLIITPIVLLAILFLTYKIGGIANASHISFYLFLFFGYVWGVRSASDAICEEHNNHTWDWQRTSALSPLQMMTGKLFGSTCFAWYAGGLSLLCFFVLGSKAGASDLAHKILILVVGAVLSQALALMLSFGSLQTRTKQKLKSFHYFLAGSLIGAYLSFQAYITNFNEYFGDINWHGFSFAASSFYTASLLLFCIWAIVGLYRNMRQELQYKNIPWVYGLFVLYCMIYLSGFPELDELADIPMLEKGKEIIEHVPVFLAFSVAIGFTYLALIMDNISTLKYRKLLTALKHRSLIKGLEQFPRWPLPFGLAILAGLWLSTTKGFDIDEGNIMLTVNPAVYVFSTLFLLIRDGLIVHYFKFGPSDKRSTLTIIFYLFVLYILIPSILSVMGLKSLMACFVPGTGHFAGYSLVGPLVQVVIVGYFTLTRWHST